MCGLVMVMTKRDNGFTQQQKEIFTTLLYLDTLRGKDSTGAFLVSNLGNVKLAKQATSAQAFLDHADYTELMESAWDNGWALVGHNRAATRGEVNDENAHPFVVDDKIVLVHNGTFNGAHKHIKDTAVDSEAIAHALAEEPDPELALRKVDAAYALIWYNVETRSLSFVRNAQRPLWFMETNDEYILASEGYFLEFCIARHNLKPLKDRGPFLLKDHNLSTHILHDKKKTTCVVKDIDVSYWKHNTKPIGGASNDDIPFHQQPWGFGSHRRHEFGGWNGIVDVDVETVPKDPTPSLKLLPAPKDDARAVWGTKHWRSREIIIDHLGSSAKGQCITRRQWDEISKSLDKTNKIKVVISDLVEADDDPKTKNFLMLGKTLTQPSLPCVFPMNAKDFDSIVNMADQGVFEVDHNGITFQVVDNVPNHPNVMENNKVGLPIFHGLNPKPVLMQEAHVESSIGS